MMIEIKAFQIVVFKSGAVMQLGCCRGELFIIESLFNVFTRRKLRKEKKMKVLNKGIPWEEKCALIKSCILSISIPKIPQTPICCAAKIVYLTFEISKHFLENIFLKFFKEMDFYKKIFKEMDLKKFF